MYVPCWNCGQDIWIETQTECRHCGKPAKRCVDCLHFTPATRMCRARDVAISEAEASSPGTLAQSYRCPDYRQSPEAATEAAKKKLSGPPVPQQATPATAREPIVTQPTPAAAEQAKPAPKVAPPTTRKRPHVIAHRGCPLVAPENTIAAIEMAANMRADCIEIDVHITADAVPVVIHDSTLDRTTNGSGPIVEKTFEEIRSLDAGSWFDERFAGERVPSLQEAIEAAKGIFLSIHVKCHENESDRAEKAIVDAIRDADIVDRCWVTHHTRHGLYRFKTLEPKLRLCWLPRGGGQDIEYIDEAFYMGYRIIQPTFRAVTPEFVDYAHKKQMWINVFWADEVELMKRLTAMGVDGILTNVPEKLQEVVGVRQPKAASND